jgi:hypothetical protein
LLTPENEARQFEPCEELPLERMSTISALL